MARLIILLIAFCVPFAISISGDTDGRTWSPGRVATFIIFGAAFTLTGVAALLLKVGGIKGRLAAAAITALLGVGFMLLTIVRMVKGEAPVASAVIAGMCIYVGISLLKRRPQHC